MPTIANASVARFATMMLVVVTTLPSYSGKASAAEAVDDITIRSDRLGALATRSSRVLVPPSAFIAAPGVAKYDPPPMPAGYDDPGQEPTDVLPKVVNRLRTELTDPYSIRDFTLCPLVPAKPIQPASKYDSWVPAKWIVSFALNSKNRFGGYTGRQNVTAYFKDGVIERLYFSSGRIESELDAILAKANAAYLEKACKRIPDAEIQTLLAS